MRYLMSFKNVDSGIWSVSQAVYWLSCECILSGSSIDDYFYKFKDVCMEEGSNCRSDN